MARKDSLVRRVNAIWGLRHLAGTLQHLLNAECHMQVFVAQQRMGLGASSREVDISLELVKALGCLKQARQAYARMDSRRPRVKGLKREVAR